MKKGYLSFVLAAIMLLCASVQMSASSESGFYTASDGLNITMQNDASYPWTVNENGQVQSNMHENNGQTSITFTNNSGKDVKCLFYISVSSEENYDYMGYSTDGEEYQEISGEYGLSSRLLVLQDGNSITFKYRKDSSASSGNDCGYIENLRFLDEGELSNSELLALYLNNPNISIENDEYNPWGINEYGGIGVAYYNIGTTITFTNNSEEDITCHFTYCWPDNGIGSLSVSVNGRNSLYLDSDREYSFVIYSGNNISFSYYMGEDYGNDCEPAYLSYLQFTAPTQEDYEHTDIPDLSDLFSEYGVSIENNEYNPWKADENGGFYSTAYVTYQYSPLTFTNNSSNTLVCTMAISSGSENTPIYLSHGKKDYDYYEGYGDEQEIINTCNNEPITVHSIVLKPNEFVSANYYPYYIGEGEGWYEEEGEYYTYKEEVYIHNIEFKYLSDDEDEDLDWTYFTQGDRTAVCRYNGNSSYITIPSYLGYTYDEMGNRTANKVDSIANNTFYGNSTIKSVTIPSTVVGIGDYAFYGCSNLESVSLSSSVKYLGQSTFYGCSNLKSITLPSNIKTIPDYCFGYCSNLTTVNLPNSLERINDYTFSGCNKLESIKLPKSLKTIGSYAISSPKITSIVIPENVTFISSSAFNKKAIESITVDPANITYDSRDNCNAIINKKTNELIWGCNTTVIPNTVEKIGYSAFSGCTNLTSINIPNSVKTINSYAFSSCSSLTSIDIPNSVTSIGYGAFYGCKSLTSITIPNSVTSVGSSLFEGCTNLKYASLSSSIKTVYSGIFRYCNNLKYVTVNNPEVITVSSDFYYNYSTSLDLSKATLYVPSGSVEAYKSATAWRKFGNIAPIPTEADYSIYAQEFMVRPGEKATVSIHMNNATPVTLWQADLKLPEGITVATDKYGDEDATLAPERTSGTNHTLSIHSIAPDSIRILSSSSVNATFDGTYGKVASIVLNVASDVKDGEYFLEFNNVKIVEPSAAAHIVGNTISKFNVYNYTIGDLNEDGEVDGIDLVMLVNHIMNRPTDNGLVGAGDINRDGDINGIDYVALLNMVMGINAKSRHEVKSVESLTGNISSASLNMNPGGFGNLDIHLNASNNQCSLMQFDITLPEGISIADNGAYIIGQNASNHDVTVQRVHKNSYRVLMYSASNARIREQQNGVISLTLTADKDMEEGTYDMHIGGQILVAADGTSIKPASTTAKLMVSEATAITTVDNDAKVDVYTTDGILVRKNVVLRSATQGLSKGVYICGDKKVIVK